MSSTQSQSTAAQPEFREPNGPPALSRRRRRRSLLFMPGDDMRKIEKGAALGADAVVIDLEDGVAINRKQAARAVAREALRSVAFGRTERLVRLNAPETGLTGE